MLKKILSASVFVMFFAYGVVARDYEKNVFGVQAGLNVSTVKFSMSTMDFKPGYYFYGHYQRILSPNFPLYLETGLQITQKGHCWSDDYVNYKASLGYLEIPVMLTYGFNINDKFTLAPGAGIFVAYGIYAREKNSLSNGTSYRHNAFNCRNAYEKFDAGFRFSLKGEWRRYSINVGYEFGVGDKVMDLSVSKAESAANHNIFMGLGYRF